MGQQIFYMSFLLIKKQITALAEKNQLKAVNLFYSKNYAVCHQEGIF